MSHAPVSAESTPASLAFVLVKAFGDLTIAASVLRRLADADRARCRLLVSPHLVDLAQLLDPGCALEVLPVGMGLPPIFDVKRHRLPTVFRSATGLRRTLADSVPGATLVFDRLSWRERFIVGRRNALPIGEDLALNVYAAHEQFLSRIWPGVRIAPTPNLWASTPTTCRIGLLPFSRVSAKNVPTSLVETVAAQCRAYGLEPVILLLEGEVFPALPGVPIERLPRRFDALAKGLRSVAAVISADSLPAHLAEYNGRAAFVAGPVKNTYYLPPAAFAGEHWGLFTDVDELGRRLGRFLERLS